ncbi:DUF3311 domain-containing protein [Natrarchaeobaculum aegyptiacum]|uniref:DUF3311 domain-containing protein n=1 Tax=Natrarchaeobaculum aegyptiacum TaxID=745377 RepID=A0A2Z2HYX2_9EURY|nr:DUF3311 domain-containing protein [Natrarchaeobaculum aegyptiacum]ARS90354.1 hypothetical protein B1756_11880 [Natrarchaeobaculum aegyptiacum]
MQRLEVWGWLVVAVVLSVLAIPWFLWGDATTVVGLPLWLWWHVGWMVLASVVFWVFTRRGWGIGIEPDASRTSPDGTDPRTDAGGDGR